jgi:hypothetical protein
MFPSVAVSLISSPEPHGFLTKFNYGLGLSLEERDPLSPRTGTFLRMSDDFSYDNQSSLRPLNWTSYPIRCHRKLWYLSGILSPFLNTDVPAWSRCYGNPLLPVPPWILPYSAEG